MIPNGSIVTYQGQWTGTFSLSAGDVIQEVITQLNGAGLSVRTQKNTVGILTSPMLEPFGVTLQIQVNNGLGYATPDDVISVIRHMVYIVTGKFPVSDSIPLVQQPSGTAKATGQPAQTPASTGSGCIAGASTDLSGSFSLGCWFKNLTTQGFTTVGMLALVALFGVGVAFYFGLRPKVS